VDLPSPRFVAVQGVLGLPALLPPSPELDEAFVAAMRTEFPNLVMRQAPMALAGNTPRLVLTSSSSQLALSPNQADFEVRFYGEYPENANLCLTYIQRKIEAIRRGFAAIEFTPATIGLVARLQFSFKDIDESPVAHILKTHLRVDLDPDDVADAVARVSLKVRDRYFVTLRVVNYEVRVLQRPVMPGDLQPMLVKPWEGSIEDCGVELTVDINNTLENRAEQRDATVSERGVASVVELLNQVVVQAGPRFTETANVDPTMLVQEVA
jgi:hypothetical protein